MKFLGVLFAMLVMLLSTPMMSQAQSAQVSAKRPSIDVMVQGKMVPRDTVTLTGGKPFTIGYVVTGGVSYVIDVSANGTSFGPSGTPSVSNMTIPRDHPWYPKSQATPTIVKITCFGRTGDVLISRAVVIRRS